MPIDIGKIEKLLMLSTSSNDFEALSAIRKANTLLKNEKMTWVDILNSKTKSMHEEPQQDDWPEEDRESDYWYKSRSPQPPDRFSASLIEKMFSTCRRKVKGDGKSFIDSLWFQWLEKECLTRRQKVALWKFYMNCGYNHY